MKVLILGGDGMLGPWVVEALEGHCDLRVTDVSAIDTPHESMVVDVADFDQVMASVGNFRLESVEGFQVAAEGAICQSFSLGSLFGG